jgi:uncharacterized cupredoxin-like copper-binding protein
MSRRARTVVALLGLSLVLAASAVAAPRIHRIHRPPPTALPTSLAVDEREWAIVPSKRVVAAGEVTLRVYNRGMDDHDLSLVDGAGALHRVYLEPGTSAAIRATLTPGRYRIWCSLLEGTPESHELFGMVTQLTVRRDPGAAATARR